MSERRRKANGVMKKWLVVARDERLRGSHILIVEAASIRDAYDAASTTCIINGLGVPDRRAIYELVEDEQSGGQHICTVLDARMKEGLFNGRAEISISPGAARTQSWSGAILR